MFTLTSTTFLCLLAIAAGAAVTTQSPQNASWPPLPQPKEVPLECKLSESVVKEIRSYERIVERIYGLVLDGGKLQGKLYDKVADYVDHHGHRLSGTETLESSIDAIVDDVKSLGFNNVKTEPFTMPTWTRGLESAELVEPRRKTLNILGLGSSVPTPDDGITAEVFVVKSFDELKEKADQAKGKIVVFSQDWVRYGVTAKYRVTGASRAAEVGAVAALVRSVAPFSIDSPHTGIQMYEGNVTKIPVAAITIEDAHLIERIVKRGKKVVVKLVLKSESHAGKVSRNTIIEYPGGALPNERVLVSGHIDSWDVGTGAMDDAAGSILSYYVLHVLQSLGLRPRRTIEAVLFSGEEQGLLGAQAFRTARKDQLDQYALVMESDYGTFNPTGLSYSGSNETACILQEILQLVTRLNATTLTQPHEGSDISVFDNDNIPRASLTTNNEKYFWFHHTEGDTISVLNSDELDRCLAVWSVVTYVAADLSFSLPREVKN